MTPVRFAGWRILDAVGPLQPSLLPHAGRPLLLTGRNGTGKSTLLRAITGGTGLVSLEYEGVPRRFAPHAALLRELADVYPSRPLSDAAATFRVQVDLDRALAATSPSADDLEWLEERFGGEIRTGVRTANVRWEGVGDEEEIDLPIGTSASAEPMQRWVTPSAADVDDIARRTSHTFQVWLADLSSACGESAIGARNSLVARVAGTEVSVLGLANTWAEEVASRAAERFRTATGLPCELRCQPGDNFEWRWREGRVWLPAEALSTGLLRWFALSVMETLREYESVAKSPGTPMTFSELLLAPPAWAFPSAPVDVFAGEPFWLAVDEPELHLYPTEENHLADALAHQAAAGRMVVATHSLQLTSAFLGTADLVTFVAPGDFTVHASTRLIQEALGDLARDSPAVLSRLSVLYVEGEWDQRVIETLFGEDLARSRVLVVPLHGVTDADRTVGTVWSRMLGLPIWILFDRLTDAEVAAEWKDVLSALSQSSVDRSALAARLRARGANDGPNEQRSLLSMLAMLVDQGLETSVQFICHGMSDVLQVLHPRRFLIEADTWLEAGYVESDAFKTWLTRRLGRDMDRASWYAWRNNDAEPWELDNIERLRKALAPIVAST